MNRQVAAPVVALRSLLIVRAVAATMAIACSSSGHAGPAATCLGETPYFTDSACTSCLESGCDSQLNDVSNACSAYIACACPGGSYDANAAASAPCLANDDAACSAGQTELADCSNSKCQASCGYSGSSGGGRSGGSSGGDDASSSD